VELLPVPYIMTIYLLPIYCKEKGDRHRLFAPKKMPVSAWPAASWTSLGCNRKWSNSWPVPSGPKDSGGISMVSKDVCLIFHQMYPVLLDYILKKDLFCVYLLAFLPVISCCL